jgi:hypothetical protein
LGSQIFLNVFPERFLQSVGRDPGTRFPICFDDNGKLKISVNIQAWGKEEFVIDTGGIGYSSAQLRPCIFSYLEKKTKLTVIDSGAILTPAGQVTIRRAVTSCLSLGEFSTGKLIASECEYDNGLTQAFLARFIVTFDFPNKAIYLKPGKRVGIDDRDDASGIILMRKKNGKTMVHDVVENSTAAKAGIKVDDILVSVEKFKAEEKSLFEIRELFCEEGKTIPLTIQRGDKLMHVSLVPKKN